MNKVKITVISPVYNEEEVIEVFHNRLKVVLSSIESIEFRILYVVDPGGDQTKEILFDIANEDKNTAVIVMSARFGHQASLIAGIDYSLDADAIVMLDSDLQHPPEVIPLLIEKYLHGYDIVNTLRIGTESINPIRKIIGNLFYFFLKKISKNKIIENAADFRLISSKVAKIISNHFKERNLFLRGIFSLIGFNQAHIKFTADSRIYGKSKYSLNRIFKFAIDGIISSSTQPLKVGITFGLIFSIISFFLMLWFVIEYIINNKIPSGWTTLVTIQLFFSGLILIILGIVGIYIGTIVDEIKGRPRYLVSEFINIQ
jgi:glycosyltransferase involved in cell wall biosynthesis